MLSGLPSPLKSAELRDTKRGEKILDKIFRYTNKSYSCDFIVLAAIDFIETERRRKKIIEKRIRHTIYKCNNLR